METFCPEDALFILHSTPGYLRRRHHQRSQSSAAQEQKLLGATKQVRAITYLSGSLLQHNQLLKYWFRSASTKSSSQVPEHRASLFQLIISSTGIKSTGHLLSSPSNNEMGVAIILTILLSAMSGGVDAWLATSRSSSGAMDHYIHKHSSHRNSSPYYLSSNGNEIDITDGTSLSRRSMLQKLSAAVAIAGFMAIPAESRADDATLDALAQMDAIAAQINSGATSSPNSGSGSSTSSTVGNIKGSGFPESISPLPTTKASELDLVNAPPTDFQKALNESRTRKQIDPRTHG